MLLLHGKCLALRLAFKEFFVSTEKGAARVILDAEPRSPSVPALVNRLRGTVLCRYYSGPVLYSLREGTACCS